ncbi:MAG TPA: hypothetical protein VF723_16875, partial [Pyrinomonadaceae bacterium]
GYGITYTTERDLEVRAEIRRGAELFASLENARPPAQLLDPARHLVPRQFAFTRSLDDPAILPEVDWPSTDNGAITYRFRPEMAASGRFEKLGGGAGYIWGSGVGYFEYVVPARRKWRSVSSVVVRAHLQPVLPPDAAPPVTSTSATLLVNGSNWGTRLIPLEGNKRALTQEWVIRSSTVRMRAARGLPLSIRFAVKADADQPYGLNISNYSEGHTPPGAWPIEVELR